MVQRDACLQFVCPVCEASPQERCHVMVGVICFESHPQRVELARNTPPPEHATGDLHYLKKRWQAS
jgi:hypothetical protein